MSHSPAFENCSPAATTPSTPILRTLGGERNLSRSPPHARDDKFSIYQLGSKEHHLATAAIGMTPDFILQSKDDIKHHKLSEKASHRSHSNLQVLLPTSVSNYPTPSGNFPSDVQWHNLQHTPVNAPHSPGALSWTGEIIEATPSDRSSDAGNLGIGLRLSRKESYKAQRQHYRREKKRVTTELLSSLEDPAVIILADWLKVRGSLKSWTKLWCVLKPGLLLLYKSPKTKSNHWVGTVLLTACHVIERPSKKDGFCFKLYHPLEQSIWATRGPHNETIGAVVQPLPNAHLIFRASSQTAGKCWLDGLELALKSSNMLLRCGSNSGTRTADTTTNHETQWSSEDLEKHFPEHVEKLLVVIEEVSQKVNLLEKDSSCFNCNLDETNGTKLIELEQSILKWKDILSSYDKSECENTNITNSISIPQKVIPSVIKSEDEKLINEELLTLDQPGCSKWKIPNFNTFSNFSFAKKPKNEYEIERQLEEAFSKNTLCTSSLKSKAKNKDISKSSITPLRFIKKKNDNPREAIVDSKELQLSTINLSPDKKGFSPKNTGSGFALEDQILKFASAFPKRRCSTPSSMLKIGFKDKISIEPDKKIPVKPKNDNLYEEVLRKVPIDVKLKNMLSINNYISGRKSAEPRMDSAKADKFSKFNFENLENQTKLAESVPGIPAYLDVTPEKFSLINYNKLPSLKALEKESQSNLDRHCSQMIHVSGKIVKEKDLEGAELSDTESEGGHDIADRSGATISNDEDTIVDKLRSYLASLYVNELNDDVGQSGEVVEELAEENKSLLWYLVKQVRPGMDLSKVVLPTFILEPRSFLDKLSDSFYHSDILASTCHLSDPYDRMKTVVKWYLSGLYRKPRGLKKPYNPVLGETFRCCWLHENSNTRTYYLAEQVSHHPPISAFYVTNRKEGFAIEATILAKSKFYGNSTSAILDGVAKITLLPLRETYTATSPYAHCKGLLMGTLSMELGGRVTINCASTAYSAEIEFRLKPFIGGSDSINMVSGRIRHHKETVATLEGHWDDKITIKDRKSQEETVLINVSELKTKRLQRQLINPNQLGEFESQRLWSKVSAAIANEDQVAATEEKTIIEEAQRERARGLGGKEWVPRYFKKGAVDDGNIGNSPQAQDNSNNNWQYNYPNFSPWDDRFDLLEYEENFVLKTLHRKAITSTKAINRTLPHLETEHSGTESDSTNSHQNRMSQGRQSVASALMRVEAELADVMTMVGRLDEEPDTPLHSTPRLRSHIAGEEPNAATLLMAVLLQQQNVASGLARVEAALRERPVQSSPSRNIRTYISDNLFLVFLLPINIIAYFIFKWLFLD